MVFLLDNLAGFFYYIYMLSGIRIYASDVVWRQILGDLGAVVLNEPSTMDINFDDFEVTEILSPIELKTMLVNASDNSVILSKIFGKNVLLPRLQSQILICLYKTGGMSVAELKNALGYSPDTSTHAVDTAIYQLRRVYGREFIKNSNGVYSIGKL
ncbi:MAG: winged helix-turn-helix domain-containing protein [Alphaproteobacteria bacterium]|nr:winged helix-turn-helix domain-containing protein [Alphaproteobacteria bacterium]